MDRGNFFTVHINGSPVLVCVIDQYTEEGSGQEMLVLALINQDNVLRIPAEELEPLFADGKYMN